MAADFITYFVVNILIICWIYIFMWRMYKKIHSYQFITLIILQTLCRNNVVSLVSEPVSASSRASTKLALMHAGTANPEFAAS